VRSFPHLTYTRLSRAASHGLPPVATCISTPCPFTFLLVLQLYNLQNTGNDGPASALAALQDYSSSDDSSPEEPGPWPKAPERFFLSPSSAAREIGPAVSDEQFIATLQRRLLELH
jgi:hypothetical protein